MTSVELVSSWPPTTTGSTAASATSLTCTRSQKRRRVELPCFCDVCSSWRIKFPKNLTSSNVSRYGKSNPGNVVCLGCKSVSFSFFCCSRSVFMSHFR